MKKKKKMAPKKLKKPIKKISSVKAKKVAKKPNSKPAQKEKSTEITQKKLPKKLSNKNKITNTNEINSINVLEASNVDQSYILLGPEEIFKKLVNKAKRSKKAKNTINMDDVLVAYQHLDLNDSDMEKIYMDLAASGVSVKSDEDITSVEIDERANEILREEDYNINAIAKGNISTQERVQDGVKAFLSTLGSSKMLDSKQEIEVAKLLKNKDPEVKQYAVNQLVTSNLRLVTSIAKKHLNRGLELMDLVQEGCTGLVKAIDKYDYKKGFKFSTYATWWIRQAITRAIADQARTIRIPVHMVETINRLTKVERELMQDLGREPNLAELAEKMGGRAAGYDEEKVRLIKKINITPISMDKPIGSDEESSIGDFVKDTEIESPEEYAIKKLRSEQIAELFKTALTKKEEEIIRRRYGMTKSGVAETLEDIAKAKKITKEAVRQLEVKILRKLRLPSNNRKLKTFHFGVNDAPKGN